MSTLSESSQDSLGWVYPAPPAPPSVTDPPEFVQESLTGTTQLIEGQEYIDVTFTTPQVSTGWEFLSCMVINTGDIEPLNVSPGVITSKTAEGFRLQLCGMPDSIYYYLHWSIVEAPPPAGEAGEYIFSGVSSGAIASPAIFSVSLPAETSVPDTVTVTPSDGGGGGTFTPTTVELTTDAPSATFTYTPASYGSKTLSVTNDGELTNPGNLSFTCIVGTYLLSGPSSGSNGVESTDFTVALPVGGVTVNAITVTPSDGGSGGTFTPTTVTLITASPSDTFTYTPASGGSKTISVTNNRSLTNPSSLIYSVGLEQHLLDTLTSYWKLDEASTGSIAVQRNDSHGTNHLDDIVHTSSGTGKINNGVLMVAASNQYLGPNTDTSLQVTGSFTFSCWVKLTTQGSVAGTVVLSKDNVSGTREYALEYADGTNFGFRFYVNAYGAYSTITPAISNGVWTHVVAWYDSGTSKVSLRINDTTTYVGTNTSALITGSAGLTIGARQYGPSPGYFDGVIDEVGFWKRLLTDEEITALYNSGSGLPYSSFAA